MDGDSSCCEYQARTIAWLSSPFRIIPRERSHTYGKRIVQYIPGNPMRWPDPISFNNSHLLARILEWFWNSQRFVNSF